MPNTEPNISGYDFGASACAVSPVSEQDLAHLEETVGWTESDAACLRRHGDLFKSNAEEMVDSWRSVIAKQPHLAKWFVGSDEKPDEEYKARVKKRFVQWVADVAQREHDRDWLNYQEEIGLRHTPAKKNRTDGAHTPPCVPLRYLLGFIPTVLPIRRFFEHEIEDAQELQRLESAWTKAVILHLTLWCRPYTQNELW